MPCSRRCRSRTCMLPPHPLVLWAAPASGCVALLLQVEDPRRSLLLHGNRTSQIIKDVLVDLHKMKGVRAACAVCSLVSRACLSPSCPAHLEHSALLISTVPLPRRLTP